MLFLTLRQKVVLQHASQTKSQALKAWFFIANFHCDRISPSQFERQFREILNRKGKMMDASKNWTSAELQIKEQFDRITAKRLEFFRRASASARHMERFPNIHHYVVIKNLEKGLIPIREQRCEMMQPEYEQLGCTESSTLEEITPVYEQRTHERSLLIERTKQAIETLTKEIHTLEMQDEVVPNYQTLQDLTIQLMEYEDAQVLDYKAYSVVSGAIKPLYVSPY